MQITRQADYALRAMAFLARMDQHQRASTNQIAENQRIPTSFLSKILSQLSIAGLINTTRGSKGGVALARSADQITMLDVIEAIDGPITLNDCVLDPSACFFRPNCPLSKVWCKVQAELVERLRDVTFSQLVSVETSPN